MRDGRLERFSQRARHALALAQDEALHFNHNDIGAEHLLLGVRGRGGMAPRMWKGSAESQFVIEARDGNDDTHMLVLQPLSASYRREWQCILPKTRSTKARKARFRAQSEEEAKRKAAEIARSWDLRLPGWKARPGVSGERDG